MTAATQTGRDGWCSLTRRETSSAFFAATPRSLASARDAGQVSTPVRSQPRSLRARRTPARPRSAGRRGGFSAPMYGLAAAPETVADVDAILRTYCDVLYRV